MSRILLVCICTLTLLPSMAFANVFAAHLDTEVGDGGSWDPEVDGPLDIYYRLNEACDSVVIEIFNVTTPGTTVRTLLGPTAYGLNTVQWSGADDGAAAAPAATYGFRVIANDITGHSASPAFDNITPVLGSPAAEIGDAQYYGPRGVGCETDQADPAFGCIFVSNANPIVSSNPGATADRQGVYVLRNDMSFYHADPTTAGNATSAYNAGDNNAAAAWGTETGWCPWKLGMNKDEPGYTLGNWGTNDLNDEVWFTNDMGTDCTDVFQVGELGTSGRCLFAWSEGTGASRYIYGSDYNSISGDDGYGDFCRWPVGNTVTGYVGSPEPVLLSANASSETGETLYSIRDLEIGQVSGDMYLANRRWSNVQYRFLRVASNSVSPDWILTGDDMNAADPLWGQYPYVQDVAVNEPEGWVAISSDGSSAPGIMGVFATADGAHLATWDGGGGTMRGMTIDAASNIITANTSDEHIRSWSPPDGPNQFTTTYWGDFIITNPVPVELSIFASE